MTTTKSKFWNETRTRWAQTCEKLGYVLTYDQLQKTWFILTKFPDGSVLHTAETELFETRSEKQLFCFILALQFGAVLKEWHNPEQWAEVLKLNGSPEYVDSCPTHNYYDANQAMIDAWEIVAGKLPNIGLKDSGATNHDTTLLNTAWGIARKHNFFTQTKTI